MDKTDYTNPFYILVAKWFGRRQPPKLPIFRSFASRKYPKPFRFGYVREEMVWEWSTCRCDFRRLCKALPETRVGVYSFSETTLLRLYFSFKRLALTQARS